MVTPPGSTSLSSASRVAGVSNSSIRRIAAAWNIGLDAIVFVDDNPLELEEVKRALPEVDCRHFPATDSNALLELLGQLRRRFARERASDEDRLRAASLRQREDLRDLGGGPGRQSIGGIGLQDRREGPFGAPGVPERDRRVGQEFVGLDALAGVERGAAQHLLEARDRIGVA